MTAALASSSSPVGSSATEVAAVGERGTEGDPLLLAAGQLSRQRPGAVPQPDPLEQVVRAGQALLLSNALEPERHRDQLLRAQLAGERAPVVLVGIAERPGPVLGEPAL